jgi:hypothetical protein
MSTEFVPIRWWQAIEFIRIDFETTRGRDPWVDRILSRPWSPYSLLQYAYALAEMPSSFPYFITVSGERVGTLWLLKRSKVLYIYSIGLLQSYRESEATGMQAGRILIKAVQCIEDCSQKANSEVTVARIAIHNAPIQRMVKIFDARPLGLATTTLTLSSLSTTVSLPGLGIRAISKSEARKAWQDWKLHAVAHVAGDCGVQAAEELIKTLSWADPLPKGKYFALEQDGEAIGFAFAHRRKGEVELGLLTTANRWTGPETAALVAAMASYLDTTIRHLTVTQRHADVLDETPAFEFVRERKQERHFVFWIVEAYFARRSRRKK